MHRLDSTLRAMFGGTFSRNKIVRRVDERDMGKCVRKISELAVKNGIVLLGQQADAVAQLEQTLERFARLPTAAGDRVVGRQPECACQERSLTRQQPVTS